MRGKDRRSTSPADHEQFLKRMLRLGTLYERLSLPVAVFMLFSNRSFHPKYGMTWRRKAALGLRIYRNWRHVRTGISYKAHLAIAAKLLELPPGVEGAVVECGCWKGGTTTNLSVICDIVGRDLIVYDSFEGLPAPEALDQMKPEVQGTFRGDLEVVQDNVRTYGEIDRCQFRKGWFRDTLPQPHGTDRALLHRRRPEVEHARLHREPLAAPRRSGLRVLRRVHRAP